MGEKPEDEDAEPRFEPPHREPIPLGESEGMVEMWKMFNVSMLGMTYLIHAENTSNPTFNAILLCVRLFTAGCLMGTFALEVVSEVASWFNCCSSTPDEDDKVPIITAAAYVDPLSVDSIQLDQSKKPGIARLDLNLLHPDGSKSIFRSNRIAPQLNEICAKVSESVMEPAESLKNLEKRYQKYFIMNQSALHDMLQHWYRMGTHPIMNVDDQFDGVCILDDVDD